MQEIIRHHIHPRHLRANRSTLFIPHRPLCLLNRAYQNIYVFILIYNCDNPNIYIITINISTSLHLFKSLSKIYIASFVRARYSQRYYLYVISDNFRHVPSCQVVSQRKKNKKRKYRRYRVIIRKLFNKVRKRPFSRIKRHSSSQEHL